MRDSRKKISKKDSLIVWNIDGEIVKKSLDERLKEVRSQARGKTREGDVVRSSGYCKKMDGSIQASARVETKDDDPKNILDEAKVEAYLADKYGVTEKVFKNYKLFLSGGARDHLWSGNMGYIGNHPNLLKIEEAEQEKIRLKKIEIAQRDQEIAQRDKLIKIEERKIKLAEQGKPDKNSLVTELCDLITSEFQANAQVQPSEEIQDHPPSPDTKQTKVLNKIEKLYRASVKANNKQLIRFKVFSKTDELLEIREWGKKELGVTVTAGAIAGRMRDVNSDLGISKRGAPRASELKPKTNEPILKKEKVDLDKLAEEFLEDDI